jgi:PIN domain nuclease of toxin-antitoxin system
MRARELINDASNELVLSAVAAAEVAIKVARGRLELPDEPARWFTLRMLAFGAQELPLTIAHALDAASLPPIHGDPWDRFLIAQARAESIPILTADTIFQRYEVEILW